MLLMQNCMTRLQSISTDVTVSSLFDEILAGNIVRHISLWSHCCFWANARCSFTWEALSEAHILNWANLALRIPLCDSLALLHWGIWGICIHECWETANGSMTCSPILNNYDDLRLYWRVWHSVLESQRYIMQGLLMVLSLHSWLTQCICQMLSDLYNIHHSTAGRSKINSFLFESNNQNEAQMSSVSENLIHVWQPYQVWPFLFNSFNNHGLLHETL